MKKFSAIITVFSILLCIFAISASAEKVKADEFQQYYARNTIAKMKNGDDYIFIYDKVYNGILEYTEKIDFYDTEHVISEDDFEMVYRAVYSDHPELFYITNNYHIWCYLTENGEEPCMVAPDYVFSKEELPQRTAEFETAADNVLKKISNDMSDFEKELTLHDTIAELCTYINYGKVCHTPYGCLVNHEAVCDGYSRAFQYLLLKCGIENTIVIGDSIAPGVGEYESHAWNIVKIDGDYYHTDVTWDDRPDVLYHAFFNLNDDYISEDHIILNSGYEYPKCEKLDKQYFTVYGGMTDTPDVDLIAEQLSKYGMAKLFYTGETNDAFLWFQNNLAEVTKKLGFTNLSYNVWTLAREYIVTADIYPLSGKVLTVWGLESKLSLFDSENNLVSQVNTVNCRYTFSNLENGTYTLLVECSSHLPETVTVTITDDRTVLNLEPTPYGDLTGDKNIDNTDLIRLKKHLAGQRVEINFAAADVAYDNSVNNSDLIRLKKLLAGQNVQIGLVF